MAIEETLYLSYTEAVLLHIELMRFWGETRYGVFDRGLVSQHWLARSRRLLMKVQT